MYLSMLNSIIIITVKFFWDVNLELRVLGVSAHYICYVNVMYGPLDPFFHIFGIFMMTHVKLNFITKIFLIIICQIVSWALVKIFVLL